MVWLGLQFDTVAMTVSLPQDKLAEIQLLVHHWSRKPTATLRDLRTLLGKLLYVSQVCPQAHLFLSRMLDTLRQCPDQCSFTVSPEFRKDLAWFDQFLPTTDGTFIIHQDDRHPVQLYIDACMSGCRALTAGRAYHTTFPPRVLGTNLPHTSRNHTLQAQSFIQFCDHYHLRFLNPDVSTVCLYISHLTHHFLSTSSFRNYVSRVRTLHKEMTPAALESFQVSCLLRAVDISMRTPPL